MRESRESVAVSAEDFRVAMRAHAAAVALVCTQMDGQRWGIAATSVVGLTAEPAQVLVCVNRGSSLHAPTLARGAFSINVLARHHLGLAKAFGGEVASPERFRHGNWGVGRAGLPLLRDALLAAEAELVHAYSIATHTVLVGLLTEVRVREGDPLLFHNRSYGDFNPVFPPRTELLEEDSLY